MIVVDSVRELDVTGPVWLLKVHAVRNLERRRRRNKKRKVMMSVYIQSAVSQKTIGAFSNFSLIRERERDIFWKHTPRANKERERERENKYHRRTHLID